MISIVITAYLEQDTVARALEPFLQLSPEKSEILVVSPDEETKAVVDTYQKHHRHVRYVRDNGTGKPAAINLALQSVRGNITVMTDGDVYIDEPSLELLVQHFDDPQIGAVTGQPVSLNSRNTVLGYWSHLLTHAAHQTRLRHRTNGSYLDCSGYFYAFRTHLIKQIPEAALAEDAVVSQTIWAHGHTIAYEPNAVVFVKYPTTLRDWYRQKIRSAGGYVQPYNRYAAHKMRSFLLEIRHGTQLAISYPMNLHEMLWTALLFFARIMLWILILIQIRVRRRPLQEIWQRVESTKDHFDLPAK